MKGRSLRQHAGDHFEELRPERGSQCCAAHQPLDEETRAQHAHEEMRCAHRAAEKVLTQPQPANDFDIPLWQSGKATNADEMVVVSHNWDEIRRLMWDYVGIVRTNKRLQRAQKRIANLQEEIQEYYWDFIVTSDLLELRNIATVAELIVKSALARPESRGLNYNLDYPDANPEWAQRSTVLRREN